MPDNIENPYQPPASSSDTVGPGSSSQRRLRSILVVAMYVLAIGAGVIGVLQPEQPLMRLVLSLTMSSVMTYWCVVDSRMRGSPIIHSLYWIIFFTWPLAVPLYLTWSRRLRGLGLALVHVIGLYGVSLVAYHSAGFAVYGEEWLDAFIG